MKRADVDKVTCANFGISDLANASVTATFLDSTFDVSNFYLGWGSPFVKRLAHVLSGRDRRGRRFRRRADRGVLIFR